jgi:hypothetical protein
MQVSIILFDGLGRRTTLAEHELKPVNALGAFLP